MLPKINFKYSMIYDCMLYHFSTGGYKQMEDPFFIKRQKFCTAKIKVLEKWWSKKGKAILKEIEESTGIKWTQKEINIYFLAEPHKKTWVGGFSDPITLFLKKRKGKFLIVQDNTYLETTIIHELVHHNFPLLKLKGYINRLQSKFKCDRLAATHILVHAVLNKIYLDLFSEKELLHDKKICKKHLSYKLAWEIVEKEGFENILKDFKN